MYKHKSHFCLFTFTTKVILIIALVFIGSCKSKSDQTDQSNGNPKTAVTGTIAFEPNEVVDLKKITKVKVRILDVSRMDTSSILISEKIISSITKTPIQFSIDYKSTAIDSRYSYALDVEIYQKNSNNEEIRSHKTTTSYPIITQGHGHKTNVVVMPILNIAKVYSPRKWSAGFQISDPQRDAHNPVVKVSKEGTVFAVWIEEATNNHNSTIFASVLPAGLSNNEQKRDALKINQLSNTDNSVVINHQWNVSKQVERYIPSPNLVISNNGDAHVAWLEKNNEDTSVYVSSYSAQNAVWSNSLPIEETNEPCSEIKLFAQTNGDVLLLWKQKGENALSLKARPYYVNSGWGPIIEVATNVKAMSDVSVWKNLDSVAIGYLSTIDKNNDKLTLTGLDLSTRNMWSEEIDPTGVKGSLVATQFNSQPILIWAEKDDDGYYSVVGAEYIDSEWKPLPQIENFTNDVGHIALAAINDKLHIVWRHTDPSSHYFDDLRTLTYSSSGKSEPKLLNSSGALNPVLINGRDNRLYLQWAAPNTKYSEFPPNSNWKNISSPFCHKDDALYPLCLNNGTEHTIDVFDNFGASAWLETVANTRSVVIALSDGYQ